jgi:hypothetical protein
MSKLQAAIKLLIAVRTPARAKNAPSTDWVAVGADNDPVFGPNILLGSDPLEPSF